MPTSTTRQRADLRVEADVLRAVADMFADRMGAIDHLVAEALSRPDTFHPRIPGGGWKLCNVSG